MNNNMPNNNETNQEGLNSVSLGNIDMGNVNPVPPVPPVDSLNTGVNEQPTIPMVEPNQVPEAPVSQPEAVNIPTGDNSVNASIPPVEPVAPVTPVEPVAPVDTIPPVDSVGTIPPVEPISPVSPVNYDVPEAMNSFNTTPVFNEIGTVPPISNTSIPIPTPPVNNPVEPKKKKKVNKTIFVLIIVLLIAAVGVGVYIFLNMSNSSTPKIVVTPKEVEIEAGSTPSSNIEDYATFSGVSSSQCSLDTSSITDTSAVGTEYTFTITCNSVAYNGTAKIVDTTAPVVVLKQVTVQVGGEVSPEDFIDACTDPSGECTYEFSEPSTVNGYLATAANYHVDIVVRDSAGNEITVTGTMIVTQEEVPDMYLTCTMNDNAYRLGLIENNLSSSITRTYTFTFSRADDYNSFKSQNENSTEVTYQNITGMPTFDDSKLTLTLAQTLTKPQLDSEEGTVVPTAYGELRAYFVGEGYICALERP